MLILNLIDLIISNIGDKYKYLFEKYIVKIFLCVFNESKIIGRSKLCRIRKNWNSFYSATVLAKIDKEANKIEPTWSISLATQNRAALEQELELVTKQCEQYKYEIKELEAANIDQPSLDNHVKSIGPKENSNNERNKISYNNYKRMRSNSAKRNAGNKNDSNNQNKRKYPVEFKYQWYVQCNIPYTLLLNK